MTVARVHEILLDHVGDDFGIGLSSETMAFVSELLLQGNVIFDNAVMDDDNFPCAVAVRMRVFFRWAAVRGPACVADSVGAVERLEANDLFQIAQLAFRTTNLEAVSVATNGDSGRVVAAIFQPPEAIKDDGDDALLAYISHDSAH